jgi:hypothetical protein
LYLQEPGLAEAHLEADVRKTISILLYSGSGDAPPQHRWRPLFSKSEKFLDTGTLPETLPAWLTKQDIDFFTENFGFKAPSFARRLFLLVYVKIKTVNIKNK